MNKFIYFFSDVFSALCYFLYILALVVSPIIIKIFMNRFNNSDVVYAQYLMVLIFFIFEIFSNVHDYTDILMEKDNGTKQLLFVSGISPSAYYIGKWLSDIVI